MKNKIGNMFIVFGSLNTGLTLFRLYKYFFTGTDITPLTGDTAFGVTFGICMVSVICYLIGFAMKGKLDM